MRRLLALLLVALLGVACSATLLDAPPGSGKVIIDADVGELNDDAQAMLMLTGAPGIDVLGITTVGGNTWPEDGAAQARRQLGLAGRAGIPVLAGASASPTPRPGYSGTAGRPRPAPVPGDEAAEFIADQVRRHPGAVSIIVLGPATNLARAVQRHPDIVPLVRQVVQMGGGLDPDAAEFNLWFDPAAAKEVAALPFRRLTVLPMDAARDLFVTPEVYRRLLAGPDTPLKPLLRRVMDPARAEDGVFAWDAVAAAVFLDPTLATDVDATATRRGPGSTSAGGGFVSLVRSVDAGRFWDVYVERLITHHLVNR
ncbi:nucleoside hydrolase [Nonomuraea sp. NPDC046570]|uniref:nucleoside hydrolase n=1 Tax=Nonomuraea sp. NPDC046570 TaxID=3155255 RepID=UPI0033F21AB3